MFQYKVCHIGRRETLLFRFAAERNQALRIPVGTAEIRNVFANMVICLHQDRAACCSNRRHPGQSETLAKCFPLGDCPTASCASRKSPTQAIVPHHRYLAVAVKNLGAAGNFGCKHQCSSNVGYGTVGSGAHCVLECKRRIKDLMVRVREVDPVSGPHMDLPWSVLAAAHGACPRLCLDYQRQAIAGDQDVDLARADAEIREQDRGAVARREYAFYLPQGASLGFMLNGTTDEDLDHRCLRIAQAAAFRFLVRRAVFTRFVALSATSELSSSHPLHVLSSEISRSFKQSAGVLPTDAKYH